MRKYFFFLLVFLLTASVAFPRKPKTKAKPFVYMGCQCWNTIAITDGNGTVLGYMDVQFTYLVGNGETCLSGAIDHNVYPYGNAWYYYNGVLVNTVYLDSGMSDFLNCAVGMS